MLHPRGQDLGDEGERVRESRRAGSPALGGGGTGESRSASTATGVCTWCPALLLRRYVRRGVGFPARPQEDGEMGGWVGNQRSFLPGVSLFPLIIINFSQGSFY